MIDRIRDFFRITSSKVRSRSGETITETLVALLISAVALTMLAVAISSSRSIIDANRTKLDEEYYAENNRVVEMSGGPDVSNVDIKISPSVVELKNLSDDGKVDLYINDEFNGNTRKVITYKKHQ